MATANVRILRDEGIVERVENDTGPYFQARLRELGDHPLVGEVRGAGLIAGILLVKDKRTRQRFVRPGDVGLICRDYSLDNGLVMRATEDSMVLSPPLVISREEIDELVTLARKSLDMTAAELRV